VVVDSLDFYCFEERFLLYGHARSKGLWVLTAPPLGFGFTLLMFDPRGMSFMDYFGFRPDMSERQRIITLIAAFAPKPFMLKYLDRTRPDFEGRRLPSVGAAPFMIAGVIATEVTQILLARGSPWRRRPFISSMRCCASFGKRPIVGACAVPCSGSSSACSTACCRASKGRHCGRNLPSLIRDHRP